MGLQCLPCRPVGQKNCFIAHLGCLLCDCGSCSRRMRPRKVGAASCIRTLAAAARLHKRRPTAAESAPCARGRNAPARTQSDAAACPGRPRPQSDSCSRNSEPGCSRGIDRITLRHQRKNLIRRHRDLRIELRQLRRDRERLKRRARSLEERIWQKAPSTCHACATHVPADPGRDKCRCTALDSPARARCCSSADSCRRSSAATAHAAQTSHAVAALRRALDANGRTPETTTDSAGNSRSSAVPLAAAAPGERCCCGASLSVRVLVGAGALHAVRQRRSVMVQADLLHASQESIAGDALSVVGARAALAAKSSSKLRMHGSRVS